MRTSCIFLEGGLRQTFPLGESCAELQDLTDLPVKGGIPTPVLLPLALICHFIFPLNYSVDERRHQVLMVKVMILKERETERVGLGWSEDWS